jgi:hypothetical protein
MGARHATYEPNQQPQCMAAEWYAPRPWEIEPTIGRVDRAWWDPVGLRLVHASVGHLRYACWAGTYAEQEAEHLPVIRLLFVGPGAWRWMRGGPILRDIPGRAAVLAMSWFCVPYVEPTDRKH